MKKRILPLLLGCALLPAALLAQSATGRIRVSPFGHTAPAAPSPALTQTLRSLLPGWAARIDDRSGGARVIYGPAVVVPGATLAEKAAAVFSTYGAAAGLRAEDWQPVGAPNTAPKATYLRFRGVAAGRPVAFSRLDLRFTPDGRLQRITARQYGVPVAGVTATLSKADALPYATAELPGSVAISGSSVGDDWVWFPLPAEGGYSLRPAWPFHADGHDAERGVPVRLAGYVDAVDGTLLYRTDEVETDVDLTVKASVYKTNYVTPPTLEPLQDLEVILGSTTTTTDAAGLAAAPGETGPIDAVIALHGPWSEVIDVPSSSIPIDFVFGISGTGNVHTMSAGASPLTERHLNAFYHVNVVHNHMKEYMPAFTGLDFPLTTNVDVAGSCNAFFTWGGGTPSINFFPDGGGCVSFALIGDVVYHEYGHAITNIFYGSLGEFFENGALGEGYSDVWAMSITADSILGRGSNGSPSSYIRRYDIDPKVYPQDIVGEVHADGEIIAGAWWDTYKNIGSLDTMTQLFAATHYALPNGPDGTEGDVYFDVLIAALEDDDDDADITNGTPHFAAIVSAFARHGIVLLGDAQLLHTDVANQSAGTDVAIAAEPVLSQPAFLGGLKLFYRLRGTSTYDSVTMTTPGAGSSVWTASIPAQAAGSIVDYYFRMDGLASATGVYFPRGFDPASTSTATTNIPYQYGVGFGTRRVENFDTPPAVGWNVGGNTGDNATAAGRWTQAAPVGSFSGGIAVQTSEDHTPGAGGACLVTGNAASTTSPIGAGDVDGGLTTVISPMFSIAGMTTPVIEYWRWYSNNRGDNPGTDIWRVQVRGSSTGVWQLIDNTRVSDASWRRRIHFLRSSIGSDSVQVRFLAQDAAPSSVVEAAVDDFALYDVGEAPAGSTSPASGVAARIYPNPADATLRVTLPAGAGTAAVTLLAPTGAVVYRAEVDAGLHNIPTRALPSGLYLLSIRTAAGVQTERVVVGH